MNEKDYESIRKELIDILSQPGGGPNAFTDLQKILIEGLDKARKEAIKQDGQALILKKLMEMDSLIIETAIKNLQSSQKHMEGVHFPLVKFARDILDDQKKEFDRLLNRKTKIKEPFDLSFLPQVELSTIRNTETISNQQIHTWRNQGMSIKEIMNKTGYSKNKLYKILNRS